MSDDSVDPDDASAEALFDFALALPEMRLQLNERYRKLSLAYRSFLFAADIGDAVLRGRITPSMLIGTAGPESPHAIRSRNSVLMKVESDQDGMVHLCRELLLSAWQRAIICADETLTSLNATSTLARDTNHIEICHIVEAIRHAFAHTAIQPTWKIRKSKRRPCRATMDDGQVMSLDMAALHGQPMDAKHHDGWAGIDRLLVYTLRRASEHMTDVPVKAKPKRGRRGK